ncbi:glutathione S-transferase T3-like [Capsella rubella]|uniref:glutathione S-transferase T3-like n=1 Tax=Capsella rubella TaxID=81985 RepID=UPI000CD56A1A|nr:glutathione S-transferase T3-like [Capsella rubella]
MDSYNPYPHSSSYLDLLNSQQETHTQGNSSYESFPPSAYNLASELPIWSSQQSAAAPTSEETPMDRKERKKWNNTDDAVLISAWLNTSKDIVVVNQQKERLNSSGHSDNDVLKVAHDIYYSNHKSMFTLEHCWCLLRYEQKWLSLNTINSGTPKGRSKRKPQQDSSHSTTSTGEDCEIRPEGVKAAKAKKNNGQGKAVAEYQSMWEIKKVEMAETEKLQKLAILDTILAKKEPLSESDELIKKKIVSQYF